MVLIAFGGGLYFALRGETNNRGSLDFDPVEDSNLGVFPDETRLKSDDFYYYNVGLLQLGLVLHVRL